MKALLIGDMHVQISNLEESQKLIKFVCQEACNNNVDTLIFLGDQFHNHSVLRLEVISFWRQWALPQLIASAKKVVFMVGNHDICGDKQKERTMSANDIFEGVENVIVASKPMKINGVSFMPFTSDKEQFVKEAIELNSGEIGKTLFCHQTFNCAQYENGFYAPEGLDQSALPYESIVSGHIHCLSNDFEYLTNLGWKRYDEISDKDNLVSLNTNTGFLEYSTILNRISRKVDEDLILTKNKMLDSLTTDKHRVVVNRKGSNSFDIVEADSVSREFSIPISGVFEDNSIDLSDDEIRLIVWVITDGCIEKKHTKNGLAFDSFRWHLGKPRKIERLSALLIRMGIVHSNLPQKTGKTKLRMNKNQHYTEKMIEFCVTDLKKTLPRMLTKMSQSQFEVFMEEYGHTDGCFQNDNHTGIQISTQHKYEADFIQELCQTHNSSCKVLPKKGSNGRYWMMYIMLGRKHYNIIKKVHVSTIHYTGKVNCFTVNNGTLMVRRNGCTFITGNCTSQISKVKYIGSPRWMSMNDANAKKHIALADFNDGRLLKTDFVSTEHICTPIISITVKEGEKLPELNEKDKNHVELIGSTAWITKTKKKLHDSVHIKVSPTDRVVTKIERKKGLNLMDFASTFEIPSGIIREEMVDALKEIGLGQN